MQLVTCSGFPRHPDWVGVDFGLVCGILKRRVGRRCTVAEEGDRPDSDGAPSHAHHGISLVSGDFHGSVVALGCGYPSVVVAPGCGYPGVVVALGCGYPGVVVAPGCGYHGVVVALGSGYQSNAELQAERRCQEWQEGLFSECSGMFGGSRFLRRGGSSVQTGCMLEGSRQRSGSIKKKNSTVSGVSATEKS